MKKYVFISIMMLFMMNVILGQDLRSSQVPEKIRHEFKQAFPKAKDVSWEKKGDLYVVEFEIGFWNNDRKAWYDRQAKRVGYKEDIPKKELPESVKNAINKNYKYYWTKDVEKHISRDRVTYEVELKSFTKEWKVIFDSGGEELSKVSD
ncbi:MAG TPA: PepSY-like domain-containing protein [Sphingobacterium sp.]|nr:PepSY-like domain-containing protein [Sphingobacterium sp.]